MSAVTPLIQPVQGGIEEFIRQYEGRNILKRFFRYVYINTFNGDIVIFPIGENALHKPCDGVGVISYGCRRRDIARIDFARLIWQDCFDWNILRRDLFLEQLYNDFLRQREYPKYSPYVSSIMRMKLCPIHILVPANPSLDGWWNNSILKSRENGCFHHIQCCCVFHAHNINRRHRLCISH